MKVNKNLMFLGLSLEYYDFIIYSFLVTYLQNIFFPLDSPNVALLKTVMIFVVGNFSRILGSLILGFIYDKFGIKNGLFYSMIIMGICSLSIGLLPKEIILFSDVNLSVYALIFFRFLQGLIYSVEIPGSILYAGSTNQNRNFGVLFTFLSFGYILANINFYLITFFLNEKEILSYGWRIPFIFGFLTSLVGCILRFSFKETSSITSYNYLDIINRKNWDVLFNIIKCFLCPATLMVYGIYIFPNLKILGFEMSNVALVNILAVVYSMIISPIIGQYIDFFEKYSIVIYLVFGLFFINIFSLLGMNLIGLVGYIFAYQTLLSIVYVQGLFNVNLATKDLKYKTLVTAIGINLCMILGHIIYAQMSYVFIGQNILYFPVLSFLLHISNQLRK